MTADGKELLEFVHDIRKFCSQLADLLGTADKLMVADGWEVATSTNVAYANPSASLDKPNKWFPHEVFRFYQREDSPRVLVMVSVLLDSDRRGDYQIVEPLLCAGWFEFADRAPEGVASEHWWWSRFHGYMSNRHDDGILNTVCPRTDFPDYRADWYPFDRASTFALSLADVRDTKALEERIIKPLLSVVHESRIAAHP